MAMISGPCCVCILTASMSSVKLSMSVCWMLCFMAIATPLCSVCVVFFWCTLYGNIFMFSVSVFPCELSSMMSASY